MRRYVVSDRNAKFELVPRVEGLQPILSFYAVSVAVDAAEPALRLGSDLGNQTDSDGNQNDPVNAYRFSKSAMAQLIFKLWRVQFGCEFVELYSRTIFLEYGSTESTDMESVPRNGNKYMPLFPERCRKQEISESQLPNAIFGSIWLLCDSSNHY